MLAERTSFFRELNNWQNGRHMNTLEVGAGSRAQAASKTLPQVCARACDPVPAPESREHPGRLSEPPNYCTHCGGCCEIAGGLPEFPSSAAISVRWVRVFGDGLGIGHRFCPFLLEKEGSGASVCAIHSFRPISCRLFEAEECEALQQDPDFIELSRLDELRKGHRSLLQLICRGRSVKMIY